MNNLKKCVISKRSLSHKLIKILDKLGKFDKVTHILQFSQSCEQEDVNSSNKLLRLIGRIIEQR